MSPDPGTRIKYADGEKTLPIRLVYAWNRGDITAAVGSSSGDKDYIKNQVYREFERVPTIKRIVIVRNLRNGGFLKLFQHEAGTWHDSTGKQVVSA